MSTQRGKEVRYTCINDCRQEGCPGHRLRLVYHGTSDTTGVEIDDRQEYSFDDHVLDAILRASELDIATWKREGPEGGK